MNENIRLIVIDSFCGAGGVTEGFHRAVDKNGQKICKVIIGINHDKIAIESHMANHPETIHFTEDFTTLDANKLLPIVESAKKTYPNAKVLFWASAECTHHSKAKGGLPRDADSRSLPEHIERYAIAINPDIIGVENVVEFIDWGPLCECKPVKEEKGVYYAKWRDSLMNLGYNYDYKKLNAADYGAYTSRIRYFGIFSKDKKHISFPAQTHSKNGINGFEKWKSVKDVLNLEIEGESIFSRKKPLVDATLLRIIAGIEKFVINGENDFLLKYNSMSQKKKYKGPNINESSPTISCQGRVNVLKAKFISKAFSGRPEGKVASIDQPAGSITTIDHHQMVTAYYGNGFNRSINEPAPTLTTVDRLALITSHFIASSYSGGGQLSEIESPNPTLLTNPKQNIVSCKWLMDTQFNNKGCDINNPCPTITANRKHFYLMNPQFKNKGSDIEKPCFTLIARMDKMPPYLIEAKSGSIEIKIMDTDTDIMKQLKQLCNTNGIIDISMRMLMIDELLRIQGFGDKYILKGTKADMKKFIGNAVECTQAKVLAESIAVEL